MFGFGGEGPKTDNVDIKRKKVETDPQQLATMAKTLSAPPSPPVDPADLGEARLKPRNATGSTNLYSQNFSWGTTLASLPGRSGLDMNLGIGYNSLVWTKVGSTMVFNSDAGSLTPGFRFGFPTIEPVFMNDATGKNKEYLFDDLAIRGAYRVSRRWFGIF
jgi:hypothetical protein